MLQLLPADTLIFIYINGSIMAHMRVGQVRKPLGHKINLFNY